MIVLLQELEWSNCLVYVTHCEFLMLCHFSVGMLLTAVEELLEIAFPINGCNLIIFVLFLEN